MGPWKRACGQISESRIGGSPHYSGSEPFLPISIEAIHYELFNYLHSLRPSTADYPLAIRVKFREPFFPSNAGRRYRLGNLKGEHWRWTLATHTHASILPAYSKQLPSPYYEHPAQCRRDGNLRTLSRTVYEIYNTVRLRIFCKLTISMLWRT